MVLVIKLEKAYNYIKDRGIYIVIEDLRHPKVMINFVHQRQNKVDGQGNRFSRSQYGNNGG